MGVINFVGKAMSKQFKSLLLILILLFCSEAYAHGGGLDGYGCHNNRKVGNYHCHRGEFAGRTFASKSAMLKALKQNREKERPQN